MGGRHKQYLSLHGEPVLLRALSPFLRREDVREVVVALPPEHALAPPEWLTAADRRIRVVAGGATRSDSVRAGLGALGSGSVFVAIHDGARPLLQDGTLERCLDAAREGFGAVAGVPAVDTLKEVDERGRVVRTPDRERLWHAQTPQVFPRPMIDDAYFGVAVEAGTATDDAALVEARGGKVRMIAGSASNIKVTRPDDLSWAESLLRAASAVEGR